MKINLRTFTSFCMLSLTLILTPCSVLASSFDNPYVQDAYDAASRGAEVIFAYTPGDTYRVYCQDTFLTDIKFQPGEEIIYVAGGDTARWLVDKASVGTGPQKSWHVYVKPFKRGISTNIIINTNKRSYQLDVKAAGFYNPMVSWSYPADEQAALFRQQEQTKDKMADALLTMDPNNLHFGYHIDKKGYPWSPEQVFDDGQKTFIKMKKDIANYDSPALFLVGRKGAAILVNYRVARNYYVVDRLFDKAQLSIGDSKVKIEKE